MSDISEIFVEDEGFRGLPLHREINDQSIRITLKGLPLNAEIICCSTGVSRYFYRRTENSSFIPMDVIGYGKDNPSRLQMAEERIGPSSSDNDFRLESAYIQTNLENSAPVLLNKDDRGATRPAWLQSSPDCKEIGFIQWKSPDGDQTYKKIFGTPKNGYIFIPIDASTDEVSRLFDDIAHLWDADASVSKQMAGYIYERVREYPPFRLALDIFSGTGIVAELISTHCGGVDLLDISSEMLNVAKSKKALVNARILQVDITEETDLPGRYDLIVCCNGLHYLSREAIPIALGNIQRAQTFDGLFINVGRTNLELLAEHYIPLEIGMASRDNSGESPIPYFIGKVIYPFSRHSRLASGDVLTVEWTRPSDYQRISEIMVTNFRQARSYLGLSQEEREAFIEANSPMKIKNLSEARRSMSLTAKINGSVAGFCMGDVEGDTIYGKRLHTDITLNAHLGSTFFGIAEDCMKEIGVKIAQAHTSGDSYKWFESQGYVFVCEGKKTLTNGAVHNFFLMEKQL